MSVQQGHRERSVKAVFAAIMPRLPERSILYLQPLLPQAAPVPRVSAAVVVLMVRLPEMERMAQMARMVDGKALQTPEETISLPVAAAVAPEAPVVQAVQAASAVTAAQL